MSNSVSFNVGEIVWAKIRGYPWWPALITGTEDDNREKKYAVSFIGDNTHASLAKKCLAKFDKEYKQFSNTRKKDLVESIKKAKEIYENKNGTKDKEIKSMMKRDLKSREKDRERKNSSSNENSNNPSKEKSNIKKSRDDNSDNFNKKRIKKTEDKAENDLINKISTYLKHITIILTKKDPNYNFDKNKENLCKIFEYLVDYKIKQEPIDFLKKTNLGKFVKYISDNIQNDEIKQVAKDAYNNLESQVINQLFGKK